VDVDDTRASDQEAAMSTGDRAVARGRTSSQFAHETNISTTTTTEAISAQSTDISRSTIVLGDENDDIVVSRGSEGSSRPLTDVEDPTVILSPPAAFRSDVVVDAGNSGSDPMYAKVSYFRAEYPLRNFYLHDAVLARY